MVINLPMTRALLARMSRLERRVQQIIDIPAFLLRITIILVNVGLWVLIIWGVRLLIHR
jgi:hypothetical protein